MSGVVATVIGVVALLIAAWWVIGIGWSLLQDSLWTWRNRHLRRVSPADLRLDPRWGPPFDTARVAPETTIRGGPIAGMPALLFTLTYDVPNAAGKAAISVCAARFRTELPRLEVRRRAGVVLPAMNLPAAWTGMRHFDDVYEVAGENPQLIRDLLTPQVCEVILQRQVPVLRIAGTQLLLLEDGALPKPGAALDQVVQRLTAVLEALPAPIAALR